MYASKILANVWYLLARIDEIWKHTAAKSNVVVRDMTVRKVWTYERWVLVCKG